MPSTSVTVRDSAPGISGTLVDSKTLFNLLKVHPGKIRLKDPNTSSYLQVIKNHLLAELVAWSNPTNPVTPFPKLTFSITRGDLYLRGIPPSVFSAVRERHFVQPLKPIKPLQPKK